VRSLGFARDDNLRVLPRLTVLAGNEPGTTGRPDADAAQQFDLPQQVPTRTRFVIPSEVEGPHKSTMTFHLYMLTNRSRVVLYIGVTNNLESRMYWHSNARSDVYRHSMRKKQLKRFEPGGL
jgi:hypothetical protein